MRNTPTTQRPRNKQPPPSVSMNAVQKNTTTDSAVNTDSTWRMGTVGDRHSRVVLHGCGSKLAELSPTYVLHPMGYETTSSA